MSDQPARESEDQPKASSRRNKTAKKALNLNLPEKLFILAIDDDQGAIVASARPILRYGLTGALLAELALANKIQLQEDRLTLTDPTLTGDALFDETLAIIAAEKKPRKLSRWVETLQSKQVVKQVAERLAERKVIAIEKKRYAWISPNIVYPQADGSAKYLAKQHLRAIVLAGKKGGASDIALLNLLKACRLLRLVFTRDERVYAIKKVDELVRGEAFGEAIAYLLADIEATTKNR